jgi:hypothetical protein
MDLCWLHTVRHSLVSFSPTLIGLADVGIQDIHELSQNFFDLNRDPVWATDAAAATLLTIHMNLVMGTLCKYQHQPCVVDLLQDMLHLRVKYALSMRCLWLF